MHFLHHVTHLLSRHISDERFAFILTAVVWSSHPCVCVKLAAILQLSQYCTFYGDSISTVITEPGQPVKSSSPGISSMNHSLCLLRVVNHVFPLCTVVTPKYFLNQN